MRPATAGVWKRIDIECDATLCGSCDPATIWINTMTLINRDISIEDLIEQFPGSVKFLISRNLPCLVCGEPSWGTLEELAKDKGFDDGSIDRLVREMNAKLALEDD